MTARIVTIGLFVLALVAVAAARVHEGRDPAAWSPVVYPAQQLPLAFSHGKHLQRGATCNTCHPAATTSRSSVDNLIPTEAACRACHPIDRAEPERVVPGQPPARCAACHLDYRPGQPIQRVQLAVAPLKFDHAAHRATPCATCHGDLAKVDRATTQHLPTMQLCLSCHRDGGEPERCTDCHLGKRGGFLETDFPHGRLVPKHTGLGDGHVPGFAREHRLEAMQQDATCGACHDRSECVACHQGVVKPLEFHPANYVAVHGVDATRGTPDCSTCHRAQSFCVACHERTGVGARALAARGPDAPDRAFHPTGWAGATGPNVHAREARKNLTACASCHREEDCLECHSAEQASLRASPHGRGWAGSARCEALDRANRRMCLKCHVTPTELGCNWRAR